MSEKHLSLRNNEGTQIKTTRKLSWNEKLICNCNRAQAADYVAVHAAQRGSNKSCGCEQQKKVAAHCWIWHHEGKDPRTTIKTSISSFSLQAKGFSGRTVVSQRPPGWGWEHKFRPPILQVAAGGVLTEPQRDCSTLTETNWPTKGWSLDKTSDQSEKKCKETMKKWLNPSFWNSFLQLQNPTAKLWMFDTKCFFFQSRLSIMRTIIWQKFWDAITNNKIYKECKPPKLLVLTTNRKHTSYWW